MISPYWSSEDRWAARGLLLGVVLLTLAMVYLTVLLNQWNNAFYSALQDKNMAAFRGQLFRVTWLITIFIFLAVYQVYLNQMLEIRWRRWLTDRYLRAWLTDGAYYRMQLQATETDNPDQRIAEDVQLLAAHTLGLFTGGLRATVTLVTFVAILWGLSGSLHVTVGEYAIRLPGYMVWVAVLYAILGTWVTDWLGRPLVTLNFDRQRYEADFRFSLVRFRENTEGVALYRGEADEFRGFRERFEDVVRNWWGIMLRQKRMTYFTSGYGLGAWIVPSIVAAPRYFRGELGLGGLMQTSQAFQQVQDAGDTDPCAVLALGELAGQHVAVAQRGRLVVGVEGQRDGHPRAARPAPRAQRPAGAHPRHVATPGRLVPLPRLAVVVGGHVPSSEPVRGAGVGVQARLSVRSWRVTSAACSPGSAPITSVV